jgi:hypothetical protein
MRPADQFEAFAKLHKEEGMAAEDIAARFGVTPTVVKQRLKLAAVSHNLKVIGSNPIPATKLSYVYSGHIGNCRIHTDG